jgi:hypothetical protein
LPPSCEPLYATNTSHHEEETFLYEYSPALSPFAHNKPTTEMIFGSTPLKPGQHSDFRNQALNMRMRVCWTVLLPTDTHRKPITSITAVLLPFVACLLTLPRSLATGKVVMWTACRRENGGEWEFLACPSPDLKQKGQYRSRGGCGELQTLHRHSRWVRLASPRIVSTCEASVDERSNGIAGECVLKMEWCLTSERPSIKVETSYSWHLKSGSIEVKGPLRQEGQHLKT